MDNPFLSRNGAKPEIFAYGNRNPQGITLGPNRSEMWMHEHGPRGGDELNILSYGANYGWPLVSFGQEYFLPKPVGESTHKAGMKQPLYHWSPSIAPPQAHRTIAVAVKEPVRTAPRNFFRLYMRRTLLWLSAN